MVQKFAGVPLRHADWVSDKKLADQETGCASDGFIMSALACGAHANFDGSVMEDAADDGSISAATYATKGDLVVCNDTALNTVQALPDVPKGRIFVSQGVGEIPIYAVAAASTAAGALVIAGAGVDIGYVEPATVGRVLVSNGANVAPVYSGAGAINQPLVGNTGAVPTFQARYIKTTVNAADGVISVPGLKANGAIVVTFLADPTGDLVLSHVVCGVDTAVVWSIDVGAGAPAAAFHNVATPIAVSVIDFGT